MDVNNFQIEFSNLDSTTVEFSANCTRPSELKHFYKFKIYPISLIETCIYINICICYILTYTLSSYINQIYTNVFHLDQQRICKPISGNVFNRKKVQKVFSNYIFFFNFINNRAHIENYSMSFTSVLTSAMTEKYPDLLKRCTIFIIIVSPLHQLFYFECNSLNALRLLLQYLYDQLKFNHCSLGHNEITLTFPSFSPAFSMLKNPDLDDLLTLILASHIKKRHIKIPDDEN